MRRSRDARNEEESEERAAKNHVWHGDRFAMSITAMPLCSPVHGSFGKKSSTRAVNVLVGLSWHCALLRCVSKCLGLSVRLCLVIVPDLTIFCAGVDSNVKRV